MGTLSAAPGRDWLDVVSRPTLAAFAAAFSIDPELSASVLYGSILGVIRIRAFFEATRAMYDRIVFIRETRVDERSFLEWVGSYRGAPIEGVTILERDVDGAIARLRLFHLPHQRTDTDEILVGEASQMRANPGPNEHAWVTEFNSMMTSGASLG